MAAHTLNPSTWEQRQADLYEVALDCYTVRPCLQIYIYIYIYIHLHTHTHTCIYAHMHTHIYTKM
jgi:hypothetical protein